MSFEQIKDIFSIIFFVGDIVLAMIALNERKHKKGQVKIWQRDALGISRGMRRIVADIDGGRYTNVKDVASAVWSLESVASSFSQSLYEERVLTEKDYKVQQEELRQEVRKRMQGGPETNDQDQ